MKYVLNIYKKLKKLWVSTRCYDSIENLPIEYWFKINREGNLKQLIKTNPYITIIYILLAAPIIYFNYWLLLIWIIPIVLKPNLNKVWMNIYDEFINRIGLSKEYEEYLNHTKTIAKMECDWVVNPSPIKKMQIKLEILKRNEKNTQKTIEYNTIIAQVSKAQGFRIDPKIVTTLEFYSYLKANSTQ